MINLDRFLINRAFRPTLMCLERSTGMSPLRVAYWLMNAAAICVALQGASLAIAGHVVFPVLSLFICAFFFLAAKACHAAHAARAAGASLRSDAPQMQGYRSLFLGLFVLDVIDVAFNVYVGPAHIMFRLMFLVFHLFWTLTIYVLASCDFPLQRLQGAISADT